MHGLSHADENRPDRLRASHRSEEHTSELQSQSNLVCRLLLEKKKKTALTYRLPKKHYSLANDIPSKHQTMNLLYQPSILTLPQTDVMHSPPAVLSSHVLSNT